MSGHREIGEPEPGCTAWVVPPRPPADLLASLVITDDEHNRAIVGRPLPYGSGRNAALWDVTLARLGYERVGEWEWREADDGEAHVCQVKRT